MPVPGSNIRLLRRQRGLSLKQFAALIGMDQGNLSKLERGEIGYSREMIEKISKVLGYSQGVLFADEALVEAAALDVRVVPVLTPAKLLVWKGAETYANDEEQPAIRVNIDGLSRHCFALIHRSTQDSPWILEGDALIFDAAKQPKHNSVVIAQDASAAVFVGRFRPLSNQRSDVPAFEILPFEGHLKAISTDTCPGLRLRATLAKLLRDFE